MADEKKFADLMAKLQKKVEEQKAAKATKVAEAPKEVPKETPKETAKEEPKAAPSAPAAAAPAPAKAEDKATPPPAKAEPVKAEIKAIPKVEEKKTEAKDVIPEKSCPTKLSMSSAYSLDAALTGIIRNAIFQEDGKPMSMQVRRTFSVKGELVSESGGDMETISTPRFIGPTAHVSIDMGATINKGDYCSVKTNVFLSVPCYSSEIDAAFSFVEKKVKERIAAEMIEIEKMEIPKH